MWVAHMKYVESSMPNNLFCCWHLFRALGTPRCCNTGAQCKIYCQGVLLQQWTNLPNAHFLTFCAKYARLCVHFHACTHKSYNRRKEVLSIIDWKQMFVKVKTEKTMFWKILRAQPSLSGLWPEWPITAHPPLILVVNETPLLDRGTHVGVGKRCPGKVGKSHLTHSMFFILFYFLWNIYLFNWTVPHCSSQDDAL